ncbi:formylmethanofuran dehydrogenase subunit C [Methanofollis aquaemaris]|uniref:formylmethanofuran dehydrogenase n=1 Tax=Methanofollis aquaemaris TaxID=126734 RepID=A0A8A3S3L1_9EURY|nr:formylmethanofuran dehydrogenase subunit C [Methanofollis aquaemaris]QSZ66513.1 formylmethanofuran dehydrogenase subunit C [Methanofollis aquaemaris]
MRIVLTMKERTNPHIPIEAEKINPAFLMWGTDELTVWEGNKERRLDEVFEIEMEGTATSVNEVEVVLRGDTSRVKRVGEYMDGGRITIEGDIGMHCANFMAAGTIEVMGNAGGWFARELRGGTVICRGDAGHYCAAGYRGEKKGMRGGKVEVFGSAGDFTAEHLFGGEVIVHGNCGDMPGVDMQGGFLTIHGDCSRPCGNMTDGRCMVLGCASEMLPTFKKQDEVNGPDGLSLTHFTGDVANRGKGNLLVRCYQYLE